uniref:Unconventional myosin-IXb n=1 Tax=Cacopsylla melanoneura TaxID=428564 RepID=A0A8D8RHW2_9HEMI
MTNVLPTETGRFVVQVYVGALSQHYEALSVEASKQTSAEEIVQCIVERLQLGNTVNYELAEVVGDECGQECKERRLGAQECPVACMLLWPKDNDSTDDRYRFYLREKLNDNIWADGFNIDPELIRDYFYRFLYQPQDREYPDLCQLPDLNETTLLENLRARFNAGHIYTYVGSILIAVNPFKFHPIYNPKYVKLYQNRRIGPDLPPHIFAIADSAYQRMLRSKRNQCIVISGESGSGKTESTNFLLHHLTALSQKGSHGSGVEQTILSAGPVLEAFGNAKTAHNNNSSRFGKFIQVNYKENGMVHGAVVQKYLLEKSRICSQGRGERNYHVFYYLLAGASDQDRHALHLKKIESYHYLNRSGPYTLDNVDEKYEFSRLQQSMEMVGFTHEKQRRLFAVLSAVLLLGNVEFVPRKSAYHHDESVTVRNTEVVALISELLRVKKETLLAALTAKHARASDETLVINYRLPEAIAARDAMAKCLYSALFDWIVMQVNHALLSKKDTLRAHQGNSIGVLDIFGFEDFGLSNSFEQLCINYANEHLQHYFNQHVFQYEQEEYNKEGIRWRHIEFSDNTLCLQLVEGKPDGLLCVLDDQANFPGASNETLLQKFNTVHRDNPFYEIPQRRENAFIVKHYAGKVKYQVAEMREKNLDLMRGEIVGVLKNSSLAFVRELVGADPVAVFRWAIVRALFRALFAFQEAGRRHRSDKDSSSNPVSQWCKTYAQKDNYNRKNKSFRPREKGPKGLKNLQSVKTLAGRISVGSVGGGGTGKRKQPLTVTAQFQQSLHCLMTTLNQANPFFIRCIKSNTMKIPNNFDTDTVQRQLRYTGMLETVRIRQAGYNVRLSYEEFIQLYRILLPQGLHSAPSDVREFLLTLNLNRDNYQIGTSKIFLRESEKLRLDFRLHQQIMASIVTIQKGVRAYIERKRFCRLKEAAITVQRWWRAILAQRCSRARVAASTIQRVWRSYRARAWVRSLRDNLIQFQAHARGYLLRRDMKNRHRKSSKSRQEYDADGAEIVAPSVDKTNEVISDNTRSEGSPSSQSIQSSTSTIDSHDTIIEVYRQNSLDSIDRTPDLPTRRQPRREVSTDTDADDLEEKLALDMCADEQLTQDLLEDLCIDNEEEQDDNYYKITVGDPQTVLNLSSINQSSSSTLSQQDPEPILSKTDLTATSPTAKTEFERTAISNFEARKFTYQKAIRRTFPRTNPEKPMSSSPLSMMDSFPLTDSNSDLGSDLDSAGEETSSSAVWQRRRIVSTPSSTSIQDTTNSIVPDHSVTTRSSEPREQPASPGSNGREPSPGAPADPTFSTTKKNVTVARGGVPLSSQRPQAPVRIARKQREYTRTEERTIVYPGDNSCDNRMMGANRTSLTDNPPLILPGSSEAQHPGLKRRNSDTSMSSSAGATTLRQAGPGGTEKKPVRISVSSDYGGHHSVDTGGVTSPGPMITVAGHTFHEVPLSGGSGGQGVTNSSSSSNRCMHCEKSLDLKTSGKTSRVAQQCAYCNGCFHTRCIHYGRFIIQPCSRTLLGASHHSTSILNSTISSTPSTSGGATALPNSKGKSRKTNLRSTSAPRHLHPYEKSMTTGSISKPSSSSPPVSVESGKFNLTGTSEFTDSTDKIISDAKELQLMHDFITQKIYNMEKNEHEHGVSPSHVDRVFKTSLREFKDNLVATYSVAVNQNQTDKLNIKYKDLIVNFLQVMQTVSNQENPTGRDFPVTMGVNAFRGFMNEFMNSRSGQLDEKPRGGKSTKRSAKERKKDKKASRKMDDRIVFLRHVLESKIINIPTACEICNSLFKWPIEKMLVCQNCRLTCHRKCYTRILGECGLARVTSGSCSHGHRVFGVPLSQIRSTDGKIPRLVDLLITTIEVRGLYTEGIYRKSGIHSKQQELKVKIDEGKLPDLELDDYSVHILANLLKLFLREMPEPLLTFEYYEEFLRAAELTEDRVSTLFSILKTLPKPNFDLMERLIFHLARVAYHEEANRMNPTSLAIVFAPCIFRQRHFPAQDALSDISRQNLCIELIIGEQLKKLTVTLKDIDLLDTAKHTANMRLDSIRSSKSFPEDLLLATQKVSEEENILEQHLEEINKEKDHLTCRLPSLTRTNSDDDLLSTDDGSLDEIDAVPSSSEQSSLSSYSTKPARIIAHADQVKKHPPPKKGSNQPPSDSEDPIMV